jgi:nitrate/nitrite transport system ATP-binding protein
MMTNGPAATIGDVLTVPLPRPRLRESIVRHPEYLPARERLLGFLESAAPHGVAFGREAVAPEAPPEEATVDEIERAALRLAQSG